MAAKSSKGSKKVEKAKAKAVKTTVHLGAGKESKLADYAAGKIEPERITHEVIDDGPAVDREAAAFVAGDPAEAPSALDRAVGPESAALMREMEAEMMPAEAHALTLPLLTDSGTLFITGVQQLTAQLLGQPECAPLLVSINRWIKGLETAKKLIVGNDDAIEGVKKLVVETGQPWGEKGSRQLTLAGAVVKVKAVNYRAPDAPLTINDLDAAKVEAYLRGNVDPAKENVEKVLGSYMKMTPTWGLKDLSPLQQKNLTAMLTDPGEWGQGLRECVKETRYVMQAPEMAVES